MIRAIEMAEAAHRPLRVLKGEAMVTVRRAGVVSFADGGRERLVPGRHRFAADHPLVQQQPELFRLCCEDDRSMAPYQLRDALRNRQRKLEDEHGRRAPAAKAAARTPIFGLAGHGTKPHTPIFGMDSYTAHPAARRPAWGL